MFAVKSAVTKDVTDTTASAALGEGTKIVLANVGDNAAYVALGGGTITATANSTAVLPGQYLVLDRQDASHIAYIAGSGLTTTLNYSTAYVRF
jgi:hypothetical protein